MRKRDLRASGKSEREGEKWRQDEGRGDASKDCWDTGPLDGQGA